MLPAISTTGPNLPPPDGKRVPFGWPAFAIPGPGAGEVTLRWTGAIGGAAEFRLTTAIDDREIKRVAVRDAAGNTLGEFDLRYAHALETFALSLPAVPRELTLTMIEGTSPLWIVGPGVTADAPGMAPHVVAAEPPADPGAALLGHLRSRDCQHAWGWMEGCVIDGLERLGCDAEVRAHLARFFRPDGTLLAETPRSQPHDDAIDNIESTLMFAPLARVDTAHPWLDRVVGYWRAEAGPDGTVLDGEMLSAEGSYTIAYPMARLAVQRGDAALARAALRQLEIRRERLWHDGHFWLRWIPDSDRRTFPSWARGVAWHFLGSVRTAQELAGDSRLVAVVADLHRLADLVIRTQREDGLWNCFLEEPATGAETSGSAGIAAALALAARAGWIDSAALAAATRTWEGLLAHVTPDGRLGGVSQSNRGGEPLQRGGYRVLSAMGTGLAAQLHAALF